MDYALPVKRLRMKMVVDSIDGGNAVGSIQLMNVDRVVLATLLLTRPSFYMVSDDLHLASPATAFVTITGEARIGAIYDGSGNIVIDDLSVGVDTTPDQTHDFEIVLDSIYLEEGHQITINSAVIEHG